MIVVVIIDNSNNNKKNTTKVLYIYIIWSPSPPRTPILRIGALTMYKYRTLKTIMSN